MDIFTAKNVTQNGNSLSLELCFSVPQRRNNLYNTSTVLSPVYLINGRVSFQARVTYFSNILLYFVKFTMKHADDAPVQVIYNDTLKDYEENKKQLCFQIDNSSCWQLVERYVQRGTCTWLVNLVLKPNEPANPLADLYDDTVLTDLELRAVDGSIHLHKTIAVAYSPVIRAGFTGVWGEEDKPIIDGPPDTTEATLQDLKRYMYTGALPDTGLEQLLVAASFYNMASLEQRCIQLLLATVTPERADDLLEFAMKHQAYELVCGIMRRVQEKSLDVDEMRKHQQR